MADPAQRTEADEPQDAGENELNQSGHDTTLDELAKSGDEKAANGGENIASGALAGGGMGSRSHKRLDAQGAGFGFSFPILVE